jgi:hypothetical protein
MAASYRTFSLNAPEKRTENIADLKWLVVGDKIAKAAFWRIYNFNLPAPQIINGWILSWVRVVDSACEVRWLGQRLAGTTFRDATFGADQIR